MAQYDLTATISRYLDRHLVFPLLEFVLMKELYEEEDILKNKMDLLATTNMVDSAMDIFKKLHSTEDVPQAFIEKRGEVVKNLKRLEAECQVVRDVFENETVMEKLREDKLFNLQYLEENFDFKPATVDVVYDFAKFQFDCGNYSGAAEYLFHFRLLSPDLEKNFSALWGKFAAEILMQNWDGAIEDMSRLREFIDNGKHFESPLHQLEQRTWLIHWSLFVFFNHPKGRDGIIDLFFQPAYLNVIQTSCPHILRYLTTAVITNQHRRNTLKDLVRAIQEETYRYRDPLTEFLECLYVNFDFEGAQQKLRECEAVLMNDFFLVACRDDFIENARLFIFETYCRMHRCIDVSMLSEKLNMEEEEAEHWIVDLIRNAHLDAKIDSERNHIIMGTHTPSVYQQVIRKTKSLSERTLLLAQRVKSEGVTRR